MEVHTPFIIERTFNSSAEKIWKALTDPEMMKQWYFELPGFEARVGYEFRFDGGPDDRVYHHICRVTEVVEGKKLAYSWCYEGYEGDSLVTFELFEEGEQTRLTLTHAGLETFPKSNPDLAKENFVAGWTDIIGESLHKFIEMGHINHEIELNADAATVWYVLTAPDFVKSWAGAFGAGIYAKTDNWKKGTEVVWMSGNDEPGVRGIVEENEVQQALRIRFFDDEDETKLGEYVEDYRISTRDGKTILNITTGPLALKDVDVLSPMWDDALVRIRQLAEKA